MVNRPFDKVARVLMAVALALVVAACAPGEPSSDQPAASHKSGSAERRDDLGPLLERFERLAAAESAIWMSGTLGDSRVPGPSIYWIDAIITLPAAEHAALGEMGELVSGALPADFSPGLQEVLPTGSVLTSPELDAAFSYGNVASQGFLVDDGATLVLTTMFD